MEIGTSMFALPRFSEAQADRKKVMPAKRAQGAATRALSQYIAVRPPTPISWPHRPAQAGMENIITLPTPKPATPRAMASRRPSWSSDARDSAGSNGDAG